MYDVDGDGFITEPDIRTMLQLLTGKSLSAAATDEIVRQTLAHSDKDGDGRISAEDFAACGRESYPWESFTVPVRRAARDNYFLSQSESAFKQPGLDPD